MKNNKPKKDNSVGSKLMAKHMIEAIQTLKTAKDLEIHRLSKGWKWIIKDRLIKLVNPSDIKNYLDLGWYQ